MKTSQIVAGILLAIGGWAAPASAIEMFTNFNNGMELGNRPLGIEWMSPVRYHENQPAPLWPGRWTTRCAAETGPPPAMPQYRQETPPAEEIAPPRSPAPRNSAPEPRGPAKDWIETQQEQPQPPAPAFDAAAVQLQPLPPTGQSRFIPTPPDASDDNYSPRGESYLPSGDQTGG